MLRSYFGFRSLHRLTVRTPHRLSVRTQRRQAMYAAEKVPLRGRIAIIVAGRETKAYNEFGQMFEPWWMIDCEAHMPYDVEADKSATIPDQVVQTQGFAAAVEETVSYAFQSSLLLTRCRRGAHCSVVVAECAADVLRQLGFSVAVAELRLHPLHVTSLIIDGLSDWVRYLRRDVAGNTSYGQFEIANLLTNQSTSDKWSSIQSELTTKFRFGLPAWTDSGSAAAASADYQADGGPEDTQTYNVGKKRPLPPLMPPPPPKHHSHSANHDDYQDVWVQDAACAKEFGYLLDELKLDKEARRALDRLYDADVFTWKEFMTKLAGKAAERSLKKPSNFVITCTQNALTKLGM